MSRSRRLSAAFAALLLFFSTQADVYTSSHCAHHAAHSSAPTEPRHHGHHADPGQPEQSEHSACTCVGMCAASSPVALISALTVGSTPAFDDLVLHTAATEAALPGFDHNLIPFATAPPFVS